MMLFDEAVHVVQQIWNALNFIDQHPAPRTHGAQFRREQGGIGEKVVISGFVKQVDPGSVFQTLMSPRALAYAARPEKEEALAWDPEDARISGAVNHAVKIPCKM